MTIDPIIWIIGAGLVGVFAVLAVILFRRGGQGETRGSCIGLLLLGVFAIATVGVVVRVTQNARWQARSSVVEVRAPDGVRVHAMGFEAIPTPARLELSEGVFAPEKVPEEIFAELHPSAKIIHSEQVGLTINETPFGHWVVLVTRAVLELPGGALDPVVLVTRSVQEAPEKGQRIIEVRVRAKDPNGPGELGFAKIRSNGVEFPPNADWEKLLRIDDPPQVFLELEAIAMPDAVEASHPDAPLLDLLAR